MSRKSDIEALRRRGFEWVGDKPCKSVELRWLPFVGNPAWLTIERWIELSNLLTSRETEAESTEEVLSRLPLVNFEIRNYRGVDRRYLFELLQRVSQTLDAIISTPRPAGIDHFEPDPMILFLIAIGTADPSRVRRCAICQGFFYAKRKDQKACSPSCANVERQRRFRHKRPEYEKNRKHNRAAKDGREQLRRQRVKSR